MVTRTDLTYGAFSAMARVNTNWCFSAIERANWGKGIGGQGYEDCFHRRVDSKPQLVYPALASLRMRGEMDFVLRRSDIPLRHGRFQLCAVAFKKRSRECHAVIVVLLDSVGLGAGGA